MVTRAHLAAEGGLLSGPPLAFFTDILKKSNSWKMFRNPSFCRNDSGHYRVLSGSLPEFSVLARAREKAFSRVTAHPYQLYPCPGAGDKKKIHRSRSWEMSLKIYLLKLDPCPFQHSCNHFSLLHIWFMFRKYTFVYHGQINLAYSVHPIEMQCAVGVEWRWTVEEMKTALIMGMICQLKSIRLVHLF